TSKLKSLNAEVLSGVPAVHEALGTPSPNNCRFCSYRPACSAYRKTRGHGDQTNRWPTDAFGTVWDINTLQNCRINLRVFGDGAEQHTFRSLSSMRHPALEMIQRGDHVGIFNARVSQNRVEFSEGPLTVLYKLIAPTHPE